MKTFTVAVVVAVVLTVICIQESLAVPITEVQELEEPMSIDNPAAEHAGTSEDSLMMPYSRKKRGVDCRFCCGCCTPNVCEFCCRF